MAARLSGVPWTTIQGWKERGTIPVRRAPEIIAAGADLAEPVTPDDFIPASDSVTACGAATEPRSAA